MNNWRGNRVLASLPSRDRGRVLGQVEVQLCHLNEILMEPGQAMESAYFPLTAVVSMVTVMDDGSGIDVATVGSEGMVGVPLFLGALAVNQRDLVEVQVPGTVLRIDRSAFLAETRDGSGLRQVLDHYLQAYLSQISQGVACNGLHDMVERCAHWILLTHDRAGETEFPFTHEFLSQMLGVRRSAVTEPAGALQSARFVRFGRGSITILDREGLEASSCECYDVTRREFDRLLAPLAS